MTNSENYLLEEKVRLTESDGTLWLVADGQKLALGPPRRALPLTHPDEYIVLNDETGSEVGVVQRIADLEPRSRDLLRQALTRSYSITEIRKISSVERNAITGQVLWTVEVALSPEEMEAAADDHLNTVNGGDAPSAAKRGRFRVLRRPEAVPEGHATREMEFTIGGTEDVQTARYPHIYIHDIQGRRYEILNCEELDLESRRAGERYF